jgi:hypothetical protein
MSWRDLLLLVGVVLTIAGVAACWVLRERIGAGIDLWQGRGATPAGDPVNGHPVHDDDEIVDLTDQLSDDELVLEQLRRSLSGPD